MYQKELQPTRAQRIWQKLFRPFAIAVLGLHCRIWFGLRIHGKENIRSVEGGVVTVCNHVNMLDCAMVASAIGRSDMVFPTLQENIDMPVAGGFVRALGGYPVPQKAADYRDFSACTEQLLRDERPVHIYPEGHLVPYDTTLRKFQRGAFWFSATTGKPIVPMVLTYRPTVGLRALFRDKPSFDLHVLPAVPVKDNTSCREEASRLMQLCRQQMQHVIDDHMNGVPDSSFDEAEWIKIEVL